MLIDRARFILLSFAIFLLASCGGGSNPEDTPPVGNSSLVIMVAGLPSAIAPSLRISGPGGFSRDINTQSATIPGLVAGTYTVTASSVISGTTTYVPAVAEQTVVLAPGGSGAVTINFSTTALALGLSQVALVPGAVFLTSAPSDGRIFIVERSGRIRVMRDGRLLTAPFLDISRRVSTEGEGGLLSVAFHPQYGSNGQFFIYYTDFERNIVVERFNRSLNQDVADATSGLLILSIPHPTFTNHYGGLASFGTDGFLYLGTGDGGGAGDPQRNAQNLNSLLGKMLRLDVNGATVSRRYTIPATNPYVGQAGRRPEIWASGLRNPWRFAFDTTGLYIADAGQDRREEIDIAGLTQGGLNYGWNIMEGTLCFSAASCSQTGLTLPAFDYEHGANDVNGCSVIGGYVYRGKAIPEVAGRYFYSDFCGGFLKSFQAGSGITVREHVNWTIPDIGQVVSFGRDGDGELYLVAADGRIHKIIRAQPPTR